jgi:hypothetical protein
MIDASGKRDPHFDEVRTVNAEIRAFGRELLRAESVSVTPLKQGAINVTLGRFKAADGTTLLFVANADRVGAADVSVPAEAKEAEQFDVATRAWKRVDVRDLDAQPIVKVGVPAGGGALVRWR